MNKRIAQSAAILFAALSIAPFAYAAGPMADKDGKVLYTYSDDTEGKSACDKDCLKMWHPVEGKKEDKMGMGWTVFERGDGMMQRAYNGKPVYHYVGDKAKGDALGQLLDSDGVTLHEMGQSGAFQTIQE